MVPPPAIPAPDPTPAGPTSGPAAPLLTSLGSSVSPRIFGSLFVGSVVLLICSVSVVLYSAGSGCKERGCGFGCVEGQLVLLGPIVYFI